MERRALVTALAFQEPRRAQFRERSLHGTGRSVDLLAEPFKPGKDRLIEFLEPPEDLQDEIGVDGKARRASVDSNWVTA